MPNTFPYVLKSNISEWARNDLYNVARVLELEYFGGHASLDMTNIGSLSKGVSRRRAQDFALHQSIVAPIIEKENTTYINPPTRIFKTKNGKDPSKVISERINTIYDDLQFDLFMQLAEHMASLVGTIIFRPMYVEDLKKWKMIHLSPTQKTLNIHGHWAFPGEPVSLSYHDKMGHTDATIRWTKEFIITELRVGGQTQVITEPHNLDRLPFELLKFTADNRRVFGFPDFELFSLCKHRSLVLANAMARMHLSDFEKLVLTGVDLETAMKNIRDKIIALPAYHLEGTDKAIQPTAQYISPDGTEALNLLDGYFKVLNRFLDMRGHVQKIFSRGADVPSAESIKLGSVDLYNKQQRKRKFLERFEQGLWDLIKKQNNATFGLQNIPEDLVLRVDYKPEAYSFANASDEVTYFTGAIAAGIETPVSWLRNRNPEYSQQEAIDAFIDNKKLTQELGIASDSSHNSSHEDNDNSSHNSFHEDDEDDENTDHNEDNQE